ESGSLRERFGQIATTGLMVLRQPLGGRPKVGGAGWAERRLFDQVRHSEPGFVLLCQAGREVVEEGCAASAAKAVDAQMPGRPERCRCLAQLAPSAAHWLPQSDNGNDATATRTQALSRLHAELIGA